MLLDRNVLFVEQSHIQLLWRLNAQASNRFHLHVMNPRKAHLLGSNLEGAEVFRSEHLAAIQYCRADQLLSDQDFRILELVHHDEQPPNRKILILGAARNSAKFSARFLFLAGSKLRLLPSTSSSVNPTARVFAVHSENSSLPSRQDGSPALDRDDAARSIRESRSIRSSQSDRRAANTPCVCLTWPPL